MLLPDHIFTLVKALHAKHPDLALGDDEARRSLQKKIVETAVARHPQEGWGWKRAGDGRPPSKDAIANNRMTPGRLLAWDCFDGSTRAPVQREAMDIDGQVFIEIAGLDHLGAAVVVTSLTTGANPGGLTTAPPPPPPPPPPPRLPGRSEFLSVLLWLDSVYREQLGRPDGVDFEGIAAHVFDTYLGERLRGTATTDARALVVRHINQILGRTDIHV